MPPFEPASQLCRGFYDDVLAPALHGIAHSAALLGHGSEVLGYDTERSTDHDWGPRAQIFVAAGDRAAARGRIQAALPPAYRGWPVEIGRDDLPLEHRVTVDTWPGWLVAELGVDATRALDAVDWLLLPQQRLLGVVAGPVFADPTSALAETRRRLAWYPDGVWWWLLACQWRRLDQEEPLVQRTAEVADDLGSAVVTARLVRDAMRLALLMARRYAPYAKWLGTAFGRLDHPDRLDRHLADAVRAADPAGRQQSLGRAYQALAGRHAALPGATALDPALRPFHDRPALVLGAGRFVDDCLARVTDERLRALPLFGSVDQLSDNVDLLTRPALAGDLRAFYETAAPVTPPPR